MKFNAMFHFKAGNFNSLSFEFTRKINHEPDLWAGWLRQNYAGDSIRHWGIRQVLVCGTQYAHFPSQDSVVQCSSGFCLWMMHIIVVVLHAICYSPALSLRLLCPQFTFSSYSARDGEENKTRIKINDPKNDEISIFYYIPLVVVRWCGCGGM